MQLVFSELPPDFPATILVVQHMPEGFTEMFARRLDESSAIQVKEAKSGDLLLAGRALICPGNRHMKIRRMPLGDVVVLDESTPVNGHRPSVDVLFRSVARVFGRNALGLLMTGMGEDGAEGIGRIEGRRRLHGGAERGDLRRRGNAEDGDRSGIRETRSRRLEALGAALVQALRSRNAAGQRRAGRHGTGAGRRTKFWN